MKAHAHATDSIIETAGERAKEYVDMGVDAASAAAERSRAITRKADEYVCANPWWIIGAAAGAGMLIGLLMRRR